MNEEIRTTQGGGARACKQSHRGLAGPVKPYLAEEDDMTPIEVQAIKRERPEIRSLPDIRCKAERIGLWKSQKEVVSQGVLVKI